MRLDGLMWLKMKQSFRSIYQHSFWLLLLITIAAIILPKNVQMIWHFQCFSFAFFLTRCPHSVLSTLKFLLHLCFCIKKKKTLFPRFLNNFLKKKKKKVTTNKPFLLFCYWHVSLFWLIKGFRSAHTVKISSGSSCTSLQLSDFASF